ncbi:hypothetical protein [Desertimonas flava]|jgi:hypothetical protein|uniref:hypothetical protein n=1 Tax=Desertimonas flava TaxID=2064846 RepID=UPI0013C4F05A|nr:hypothetical protein [Desertimonas flava]
MIKTAIFAAGVACGCMLGSSMTPEQRRKLAEPMRRLAGSGPSQRLGGSVRHVADTAAELAASKVDDLASAIQPNGDGHEQASSIPSGTSP